MTATHPAPLRFMRVDQVGSLLRPPALKEMFVKHEQGEASDEALVQAQNEAIRQVIARQDYFDRP